MTVRLHADQEELARYARTILGVSMSELIRLGVEYQLSVATEKSIKLARDRKADARKRLKAIQFVDQVTQYVLKSNGPPEVVQPIVDMEHELEEQREEERREKRREWRRNRKKYEDAVREAERKQQP